LSAFSFTYFLLVQGIQQDIFNSIFTQYCEEKNSPAFWKM